MPRLKYPPALTLCEIEWEDINEDGLGDASAAKTAHRCTVGYFLKKTRHRNRTIVVTCATLEIDEEGKRSASDQSGWCSYPVGAIVSIKWSETPTLEDPPLESDAPS